MFSVGTRICVAVLSATFAWHSFNCVGMSTPQQAMQCCKSMQCMSHHRHHNDCCKSMPASKVDIGQPTSATVWFALVACGVVGESSESRSVISSVRMIADQSHAPPLFLFAS